MISSIKNKTPQEGKTKVRKIFWLITRYVLPFAAIGYILFSLAGITPSQWAFWKESLPWSFHSFFLVLSVVFLTFLNWLLEAVKWQKLAQRFERVSLMRAYAGVLYGISLGMVTPRRAGEFAGRVVVLKPENQLRGIAINTAGSFTQFMVTLLLGHVGVALAILAKAGTYHASREGQLLLFSGIALLLSVLFVIFARKLLSWLMSKTWFPRKLKIVHVVMTLTRREMAVLFSLSVLRYAIFITQFHLLLYALGIRLMYYETFMVLSIIYLFMVGIPVSGLAEAGIRGSVALLVFSLYLGNKLAGLPAVELTIVSATLLLWLFNLALPGLLGAGLSLSGKFKPVQNN